MIDKREYKITSWFIIELGIKIDKRKEKRNNKGNTNWTKNLYFNLS